ncbi:MAG TPA: hypothetical protein VK934_02955 [Fimbriimonas sp.]|nr:hypothetical protein [Fimbriimonas sp.]
MGRRRGIALIELIVACLIFALAMMAMFQAWRLCFSLSVEGREQALASQIARGELEMSKIQGFNNLPLGTLSSSTAYTGKWTEGARYYDFNGVPLSSTAPASLRAYYSVRNGTDTDVLRSATGDSYTLATTSLRSVVVKVYRVLDSQQLVKMGVHITRGGL